MSTLINQIISDALATPENESTFQRFQIEVPVEQMVEILRRQYIAIMNERSTGRQIDPVSWQNIQTVAKWLTTPTWKSSLLLYGGVGNGKTTLAKAVIRSMQFLRTSLDSFRKAQNLAFYDRKEEEREISHLLSSVPSFRLYSAQELARIMNDDEADQRVALLKSLTIDDLGCEPAMVKVYGTETTPISDIIYARYDQMLPTIITTNLDMSDIQNRYGRRVQDRLKEAYVLLGFNGPSFRR